MSPDSGSTPGAPALCVVAVRELVPDRAVWLDRIQQIVRAAQQFAPGVLALQLRLSPGEETTPACLDELVHCVQRVDPEARVPVSWNGRAGVPSPHPRWFLHLPEAHVLRQVGPLRGAPSVSVHTDATWARVVGARFALFAPVFAPTWKASQAVGVDGLAAACKRAPVPVLAQGGITPERVAACLAAGAHGVAVSSGVLCAADVPRAVQDYAAALMLV